MDRRRRDRSELGNEEVQIILKESALVGDEENQKVIDVFVWNENQPFPDTLIGQAELSTTGIVELAAKYDPLKAPVLKDCKVALHRPLFGDEGQLSFKLTARPWAPPDPEFVVYFKALSARNMPETEGGAGIFGKQDPYVKLTAGSAPREFIVRSTVKDGAGENCDWSGETMELRIPEPILRHKTILIEVWNDNSPATDTLIGSVVWDEAQQFSKNNVNHVSDLIDGLMVESKRDGAPLVPKLGRSFPMKFPLRNPALKLKKSASDRNWNSSQS